MATSRLPIRINNNAEFTAANGVTGGSGTPSDPWLIEGWDISGHDYGYCIYMGNTTEHFTVRDCRLHDARGNFAMYYSTESGMILHNVANGTVTGNDISHNDFDGVYLHGSVNVLVSNNVLTGNRWGIMLMAGSADNTILGNTVNASTDYGMGLIDSARNTVEGNNVSQNADMGIFLGDSANNTLTGNTVAGNTDGIYLDFSNGNTVSENNVTANTGHGIYLWESAGNRIFHNNMPDNPTQAHDNAGTNSWDNGFPSGGNHWGDYAGIDANLDGLGDTAYSGITGGMGARDRYPFMEPWFSDTEAPVARAGPDQDVDEGMPVWFDGSASTDNVGVAVYTWAFDYGAGNIVMSGVSPSHNFTIPGTYNVTLEAMDPAGNRGIDTMTVAVNDITAPIADAGPDRAVDEGTIVTLNGSASTDNLGITSHTWTFNDGIAEIVLVGCHADHLFKLRGIYPVELNVTDAAGHWSVDSMTVTVQADTTPPNADAGPDLAASVGEPLQFNGSASTDNVGIENYTWELTYNGTAIAIHGPCPEFIFWTPGNYTVALTVLDAAGNSGKDYLNVTVWVLEGANDNGTRLENDAASQGNGWVPAMVIILGIAACVMGAVMLKRPKKPKFD